MTIRNHLIFSLSLFAIFAWGCGTSSPNTDDDTGDTASETDDTSSETGDSDSDSETGDSESETETEPATCADENPCGDHGNCLDTLTSPTCVCDAGWDGEVCDACAAGWHDDGGACVVDSACMANSCGGNGTCDDAGGVIVCSCDTNYDSATNCADCVSGYHESVGSCVADEICETTSCSGNGTCDDSSKEVECDCDPGWAGDSCDSCAGGYHVSGDDCVLDQTCMPTSCAGNGTCDDTGGIVACNCDIGYDAASYCLDCVADYHKNAGDCVPNETCEANSCSGNGTCDDDSKEVVCTCGTGWTGDACDSCAAGYHSDGMGGCVQDEQCLSSTCNYHGDCSVVDGLVECVCSTGYEGDNCEACDPGDGMTNGYHMDGGVCIANTYCADDGPASDDCSGNGTCNDADFSADCECQTGWTGDTCNQCASGYHLDGTSCVLDQQCLPTSCSGNGQCSIEGGVVRCDCDGAFSTASYCSECTISFHLSGDVCVLDDLCEDLGANSDDCNGNGSCSDVTKEEVCTCNTGYTGDVCNQCAAGFHMEGTECVLDESCIASSCSYNGTCAVADGQVTCSCSTGYDGDYCDICDAGDGVTTGYHMDGGVCVLNEYCTDETPSASADCSNNGSCNDATFEIVCECNTGWGGDICDECGPGYISNGSGGCDVATFCQAETCSFHGDCGIVDSVVTCTCDAGYDASTFCSDCASGYHMEGGICVVDETCVQPGANSSDCGGNGTCSIVDGLVSCSCNEGWSGDACGSCDTDNSFFSCDSTCCAAGTVCYMGACCTPTSCGELTGVEYVECGPAGDDGCGGTVDCGDCGADGVCDTGTGTCTCDDNYGVLTDSEGHECVHACDGYLPSVGCCDENWRVYCDAAEGTLQTSYCEIFAPPYNECGWSLSQERFNCQAGETTPAEYTESCPANIVIDKTIPACEDDEYEGTLGNNDSSTATPILVSPLNEDTIVGVRCVGDMDVYAVELELNDTLDLSLLYNESLSSSVDIIVWYDFIDGPYYQMVKSADLTGDSIATLNMVVGTATYGYGVVPTAAGTYYIQIRNNGEAVSLGYSLTATRTPAP